MGPTIYNLAKHLSAANPLSEKDLIEYLDGSSRSWESCILASSKWFFQDQHYLVSMLDDLKKYLSVIVSHCHRDSY